MKLGHAFGACAALAVAATNVSAQLYRQSDVLSRSLRTPMPGTDRFDKLRADAASDAWAFEGGADLVVDIGHEDDRTVLLPFAVGWQTTRQDVIWSVGLGSQGFVHAWSPQSRSGLADLRLSTAGTWKVGPDGRLTPALTLVIPTRSDFGSDDFALALGAAYAHTFDTGRGIGASYEYTRADASSGQAGSRLHSVAFSAGTPTLLAKLQRDLPRHLPASSSVYLQFSPGWQPLPGVGSYVFFRWSQSGGDTARGVGLGASRLF